MAFHLTITFLINFPGIKFYSSWYCDEISKNGWSIFAWVLREVNELHPNHLLSDRLLSLDFLTLRYRLRLDWTSSQSNHKNSQGCLHDIRWFLELKGILILHVLVILHAIFAYQSIVILPSFCFAFVLEGHYFAVVLIPYFVFRFWSFDNFWDSLLNR